MGAACAERGDKQKVEKAGTEGDEGMIVLRAERRVYEHGWSLYGFEVMNNRATHSVQPLTLKEHEEGMLTESFAKVSEESLQNLMDDLWIGGLRPSDRLRKEQPAEFMREQVEWDRGMIETLVKKLK
jgi:hypothetical protein